MKDDYPTYYPRTSRAAQSLWIWALLLFAAFVAGLFLGSAADAETTTGPLEPAAGTWRAYRGTGYTTLVCSANSEAAVMACAAADAERRATTTRYQLRYPNRYILITYVVPAPAPPPQTGWTHCANQGELCAFTGTRTVRYGVGSTWAERTLPAVSGGVECSNVAFGNPAPNALKQCELQGAIVTPPPATGTGTALLTWTPPTHNTDGSPLTDLTGYRVHYGRSAAELVQSLSVTGASVARYTVGNLGAGTWYLCVSAVASTGATSDCAIVSKAVQ